MLLLLIGWEGGTKIFSQSQSVALQNQSKRKISFDTQLKTALKSMRCSLQEVEEMKLEMEELNNEVSNVEQQVS